MLKIYKAGGGVVYRVIPRREDTYFAHLTLAEAAEAVHEGTGHAHELRASRILDKCRKVSA